MAIKINTTDQAAPELLPCPFCGKSAKLIKGKIGHFYAECQWCEVSTPNWRPDADMARSDWNRRADLAAPSAPAEVDGLVERLSNAGHGGSIVPNPRLCSEAATALTAQQAKIERLRTERDALDRKWTTAVQLAALPIHTTPSSAGTVIVEAAAKVLPVTLTTAQLADACMSHRHDYGIVSAGEREDRRREAADWWRCLRKTLAEPSAALRAHAGEGDE